MKKILFKPEMVRAIMEGRKTQTRRIHANGKPRFEVGEVVYVGETYRIDDSVLPNRIMYAAEMISPHYDHYRPWKSGMFMPEKYARIFLKITRVEKQPLCYAWPSFRAEGFESVEDFHNYFYKINPFLKNELSRDVYVWAYTFEVIKQ